MSLNQAVTLSIVTLSLSKGLVNRLRQAQPDIVFVTLSIVTLSLSKGPVNRLRQAQPDSLS
jgi:hypothetical protein